MFGRYQDEVARQLRLGELLTKGVGNQVGFHVYDSDPMFDLGLSRFMGMALGSFRGRGMIDDDFLVFIPLISALNGPVYASVPVQDRDVVDQFLDRFDRLLAELATQDEQDWFFTIEQDFYHLASRSADIPIRAYGFAFGPIKWRFFWSRMDDAVYIASKREVIEDLAALASHNNGDEVREENQEDAAHALIRIRPQNWDRALDAYRLGWEENHRQACLANLGPLSGLSRAMAAVHSDTKFDLADLEQYAGRVYDVHHFCPDEGEYEISEDGKSVTCSIHGAALTPRQSDAPAQESALGKQLKQFRDLSVRFSFLEDGLHAVVTLDRQPVSGERGSTRNGKSSALSILSLSQ